MKSSDIKKQKTEEEYIEEADPSLFGNDNYQSSFSYKIDNFNNKLNKLKENKYFKPLVVLIPITIVVIIISLSVIISANKKIGISSINTTLPDIIYYDEEYSFTTEVFGEGKLYLTNLKFYTKIDNPSDIIFSNDTLVGDKLTNTITAKQTDTFTVHIEATLNKQKVSYQSNEITVCKRLDETSLNNKTYTVKKGNIVIYDIGIEKYKKKCFANLTYTFSNENIAKVDKEAKTILGVNTGTTILTVSDGVNKINLTIVVN